MSASTCNTAKSSTAAFNGTRPYEVAQREFVQTTSIQHSMRFPRNMSDYSIKLYEIFFVLALLRKTMYNKKVLRILEENYA